MRASAVAIATVWAWLQTAHAGPMGKPDSTSSTTVSTYEYVPATTLAKVPAIVAPKPLAKDRVVKLAISTWGGWAPLLWANRGLAAGQAWKDSKGGSFRVELVVEDDPVKLLDRYAAGEIHAGWATVDQLPLFVQRLGGDAKAMPRVVQLVDWSHGGDGIVVRDSIKQVGDLKGKTIVLAQNSPSHFMLLALLAPTHLTARDVNLKFVKDTFQATAAFERDKSISAAVGWQPDLDTLGKQPGNRVLLTTREASKLLATVWFTRADFAKQHAALVEGLVRGMLEAREQIDANATEVEKLMDAAFKLPSGTAATMRADTHLANYAENRAFFDPKSRTGLDSTWKLAAGTWRRENLVEARFEKSKVGDGSFVAKLGKLPAFAQQTDEYPGRSQPAGGTVDFDKHTVLTAMIVLSFFPNSSEVLKKVPDPQNPKKQVFYDKLVESTLEGMAQTAARFPHVRLEIGGHTDSSMKDIADESLVQQLSEQRANAIRQILIDKYKVDPNQLLAKGYGWSRPRAGASATDHAANRRVELRVHAAP